MVAKLSSVRIIVAASRATSVPERPIATPMSARRSAGASLTPSPVIATTWPAERRASAMRSLASGELRAKTTSGPELSRSSSWRSVIASSSVPVTTCMPPGPVPMPARRAVAVGGDGGGGGQGPAGGGQHPQAAARVFSHDACDLIAVGGGDRYVAAAAVDPGGPGEDFLRGAFGVHHQAAVVFVHGGHELEPGVEAEQLAAARFPAGQGDVDAVACGQAEQREFGGVTGRLAAGAAGVRVVAGGHALGEQAKPAVGALTGRGAGG